MNGKQVTDSNTNRTRRSFLMLMPLGVLAGVFSSFVAVAFRFLRPVVSPQSESWVDVAALSELTGPFPLPKVILAEHSAGWAISTEEHHIYVLPEKEYQVLSAVCPHEGCEVSWESNTNRFSCPCHESYFAADGSRIKGPARRGLDPLPRRVQDGKLQVQFRFFENNVEDSITRT
jgi:Rieske Fe-S protein